MTDGPATRPSPESDVVARRLPMHGPRSISPAPRVCIATSDLAGPVRNGGVGTACATLAEALAGAGHDVTVLFAGPFEVGDAALWREHYARRRIVFEVPEPCAVRLEASVHVRASYEVYLWLKRQPRFDVVQFPEINGVGFYALQAKRLGLAFHQTFFCVVLHSPTMWHRTENRESVDREDDLALDFVERECVVRADALVSPTRYLLSWAVQWGFQVPVEVYVQPYVSHSAPVAVAGGRRRVSEIVFFGRLESRKGLELWCDALDLLASRGALTDVALTFLGKIGRAGLEDGATYVRRRAPRFGVPVRLETELGRTQAVAYLRERPCVAVMPSLADNMPYAVLECLAEGIPFVSLATGGIPEMIAAEDHEATLAAPDAASLAAAVERVLREGASPVRIASAPDVVRDEWIAWHEVLAARARATPAPLRHPSRPLVSVCMATRNRPELLREALQSIGDQTYAPIEVVVVDDASDRPEAITAYDALALEFADRGWRLLRRSAKGYPGAARNAAAAAARGEFLLFMDDDNLARPAEIETFVEAIRHAGVSIVTCLVDHFWREPGQDVPPVALLRWLPLGPAVTFGLFRNRFGDTNMLIRRDAFERLGGFDEHPEAAFAEDWIFLSRAALAGVEMAVLPEPLFWYRAWDGANGQGQPPRVSRYRRLGPYLEDESPERKAILLYAVGLHERAATFDVLAQCDEARSRALAGRFERGQAILCLGAGDADSLVAAGDLAIAAAPGGILLRSSGTDPIAWLPVSPPPDVHSIVRIDLSTACPTLLQMFWSTREFPHPTEAQSTMVAFPSGRNVRWVEVPAASHVGRLRMDPSFAPGDIVLHSLEIRCEIDRLPGLLQRLMRPLRDLVRRPALLPIADRFRQGAHVVTISCDAATFAAVRAIEVSDAGDGVRLRCLDDDPRVELPPFEAPERAMTLRLRATSSIATRAQVFWATRGRPYCEEQSAWLSLRPGPNIGYASIPGEALGELRLDPATAPGEVVVHAIEIRADR